MGKLLGGDSGLTSPLGSVLSHCTASRPTVAVWIIDTRGYWLHRESDKGIYTAVHGEHR